MIRFGFISTYPPTLCGLATFTAALAAELDPGSRHRVVRLVDVDAQPAPADVVYELHPDDPEGPATAAVALMSCDVVVVQHEFGVYGGEDGDQVLAVLRALPMRTIVVLHTVLPTPSANQRRILEAVVGLADAVITMSVAASERLAAGHTVDMEKVRIVPHGAPAPVAMPLQVLRTGPRRPLVLTWGLLGPGKGIEWAIAAMSMLQDVVPQPRYLVAGQTHPKVLLREGEAYRDSLTSLIGELALGDMVTMSGHYRSADQLGELVASADVVMLPYDSTDQVTSGVLIEAVAALKPVVATGFPHAVELLGRGAGLVVPHRNPVALADAVRALLVDQSVNSAVRDVATAEAPGLLWPAVATQYRQVAEELTRVRVGR